MRGAQDVTDANAPAKRTRTDDSAPAAPEKRNSDGTTPTMRTTLMPRADGIDYDDVAHDDSDHDPDAHDVDVTIFGPHAPDISS